MHYGMARGTRRRAVRAKVRRRSVALATVLAVLLVVASVGAGAVGADAWRNSIRDQSKHEFNRQANAVDSKVRQHVADLDGLFSLAARTSRTGKTLSSVFASQDAIKKYPGVIALGHAVGTPNGDYRFTDEYSSVSAFGIVDLRLRAMIGPQMRTALAQAARTGHRAASTRSDIHWFTADAEPTFFVVEPVSADNPAAGWIVALIYGNWMLEDSLQAAGSTFRAELLDGSTILSGDYLPIGSQATKPPRPIDPAAPDTVTTITGFGRPISLLVADNDGVTKAHIGTQPTMLFAGLSLLGLLSGLLVWVLGRSRTRALRMVDEATEQLRHQAFHDSLTGLANRALLADRMTAALTRRTPAGTGVAVLLCDLDDFKTVNDSLGHAAGDELLTEVARRLQRCARSADTVARLGGDEFAVLLEAPAGEAEAVVVAERILAELTAPISVSGLAMTTRSSIGIAVSPDEGIDADGLLRNADIAMYAAKRDGKARAAVYQAKMEQRARRTPVPPRRSTEDALTS
jgi:diguanylate cyclase (GGDEF)-like protein